MKIIRFDSNQEARVRREINAQYGSHEVDCVEHVGDNEYRARLFDGTVAIATVQKDGTIQIKENAPWY